MKKVEEKIAGENRIKSVLVWKDGEMLTEYYSECSGREALEPLNSITKTVVSLLLGIALDRGFIGSVHDDIRDYVPGAKQNTIEEHLTMASGMEWGSDILKEPYTLELLDSESWIDYICSKEAIDERRGLFKYNGASSHLIGKAISNASGMVLEEFAEKHLFHPLRIEAPKTIEEMRYSLSSFDWKRRERWDTDPEGNSIGSFGLSLKARDALKLGKLILNRGEWDGERIVSKEYIEEMTRPRVRARLIHYGYHIWTRRIGGVFTASALGYGNQYLTIVPDRDISVVLLSENDGSESKEIEKLHSELIRTALKI